MCMDSPLLPGSRRHRSSVVIGQLTVDLGKQAGRRRPQPGRVFDRVLGVQPLQDAEGHVAGAYQPAQVMPLAVALDERTRDLRTI
jgi:hypothetical protein